LTETAREILEKELKKLEFERGMLILALVLLIVGYGLVFWGNWKVAIGLLFVHWSINIERKHK